jgi:hypothetical protein
MSRQLARLRAAACRPTPSFKVTARVKSADRPALVTFNSADKRLVFGESLRYATRPQSMWKMARTIRVKIADTAIEPRHPRRLEKNRNIAELTPSCHHRRSACRDGLGDGSCGAVAAVSVSPSPSSCSVGAARRPARKAGEPVTRAGSAMRVLVTGEGRRPVASGGQVPVRLS